MQHTIKTNLHFHTGDDPGDIIEYSFEEGIDHAAKLGFGAIALTCHRKFTWTPEYAEYAESKGILLIPGIEINIDEHADTWGRHLVILGADKDAESIRTFSDLEQYRNARPNIFILAPHPYFYGNFSLHEYLERYIHLMDAIEYSWFYSRLFNRNRRAEEVAKNHNLPLISTSDTHFLHNNHMDNNYALVHTPERSVEAIFEAIRQGNFENVTSPRSAIRDMFLSQGVFWGRNFWKQNILRTHKRL